MPTRIKFTNADGNTHLELTGFYVTMSKVPGVQEMPNVFIRGHVGQMSGQRFVGSHLFEARIDDPVEVSAVLSTPVQAGALGAVLRDALMDLLISSGRITGTTE